MTSIGIKAGSAVLFGILFFAVSVRAQQAGDAQKGAGGDLEQPFLPAIDLSLPGPERLFRFESEQALRNRLQLELKDFRKGKDVEFPPTNEAVALSQLPAHTWPFLVKSVEPNYVCYKRLWFEQKNSERQGWDFGVLQPVVSTGIFYTDLALFPLHWAANPFRCYDCSAGQCLPGDAVPLLWNPFLSK